MLAHEAELRVRAPQADIKTINRDAMNVRRAGPIRDKSQPRLADSLRNARPWHDIADRPLIVVDVVQRYRARIPRSDVDGQIEERIPERLPHRRLRIAKRRERRNERLRLLHVVKPRRAVLQLQHGRRFVLTLPLTPLASHDDRVRQQIPPSRQIQIPHSIRHRHLKRRRVIGFPVILRTVLLFDADVTRNDGEHDRLGAVRGRGQQT